MTTLRVLAAAGLLLIAIAACGGSTTPADTNPPALPASLAPVASPASDDLLGELGQGADPDDGSLDDLQDEVDAFEDFLDSDDAIDDVEGQVDPDDGSETSGVECSIDSELLDQFVDTDDDGINDIEGLVDCDAGQGDDGTDLLP